MQQVITSLLAVQFLLATSECEIVATCIESTRSEKEILCAIDHQGGSIDYLQQLCKDIEYVISKYPNLPVWITGDLNLPNIDWENHVVKDNSNLISLCNIFWNL